MATLDLSRDAVLDMIGAGRGPQDGVWIPLVFVEWLGSYTTAAMMNQILYYRDIKRRQGEDEFYMSYPQWRETLHLTEREVRNGLDRVRQVGVTTKAKRAPNGDRVLYYRVDADAFLTALQAFLSGRSVQNVRTETDDTDGPGPDETYGRSNTKTSTKISTERETPPPRPVAANISRQAQPSTAKRDMHSVKPIPATPLPDIYPLTAEMQTWAHTNVPSLNGQLANEHAKFCAYYRGIAHDKKLGRRADWRPVWELWMRRVADGEFAVGRATQPAPKTPQYFAKRG